MARTDPQVNVRVPADILSRIRSRAEIDRRSINSQIVHYLDRALAAEETKSPATAATVPGSDQNHPMEMDGGNDA